MMSTFLNEIKYFLTIVLFCAYFALHDFLLPEILTLCNFTLRFIHLFMTMQCMLKSPQSNLDKDKMTKHVCCVQWLVWEVSTGNILYRHRATSLAGSAGSSPAAVQRSQTLTFSPQSTISRPPVQWLVTMDTVTNVEFSVREYIKVKNLLIESAY